MCSLESTVYLENTGDCTRYHVFNNSYLLCSFITLNRNHTWYKIMSTQWIINLPSLNLFFLPNSLSRWLIWPRGILHIFEEVHMYMFSYIIVHITFYTLFYYLKYIPWKFVHFKTGSCLPFLIFYVPFFHEWVFSSVIEYFSSNTFFNA